MVQIIYRRLSESVARYFTRPNAPLPPPSLSNIFRSLFIPVIKENTKKCFINVPHKILTQFFFHRTYDERKIFSIRNFGHFQRDFFHAQPMRNPYGVNVNVTLTIFSLPKKIKKNSSNNFRSFFSIETLIEEKQIIILSRSLKLTNELFLWTNSLKCHYV